MNHLRESTILKIRNSHLTFSVFFISSCCLLMVSCSHYYYCPNSNNTPLLSEGEARINIQYAATEAADAIELQSAFAVSKHFGGMVNLIAGGGDDDYAFFGSGNHHGTGKLIEVGAGYFTPINSSPWIFEAYGGVGTGGVKNNFGSSGRANVTFTKWFIQPDIGLKFKGFEFGLSSRFSFVKQKLNTFTLSGEDYHYEDVTHVREHPNSFLWEPGVVLRVGGEKLLFQLQYTSSINITNPELVQGKGIFNMGFSIPIKYRTATK
jgi:hypothetical protein